jgi:hypothetical protein
MKSKAWRAPFASHSHAGLLQDYKSACLKGLDAIVRNNAFITSVWAEQWSPHRVLRSPGRADDFSSSWISFDSSSNQWFTELFLINVEKSCIERLEVYPFSHNTLVWNWIFSVTKTDAAPQCIQRRGTAHNIGLLHVFALRETETFP